MVAIGSCRCIQLYIFIQCCVQRVHLEQVTVLTQQNVHGYWGSTVTVHNIPSGIGKAITVWLGTYIGVVNKILTVYDCDNYIIKH